MKISAFKEYLSHLAELRFVQPNGTLVPLHFHITEAGLTTKHFIDCGGTERVEKTISFQLWVANDTEHRLVPAKLLSIISLADSLFHGEDIDVEMEYQLETISRFGLGFRDGSFVLQPKFTDCLAKDTCGIPQDKLKVSLQDIGKTATTSCCDPKSNCC